MLSLYLFLIMLPTVHFLARRTLHHVWVARAITAAVFVLFTVPYKLLSLTSLYYYRSRPEAFEIRRFPTPLDAAFAIQKLAVPKLQFLFGGSLDSFPAAWLFVPLVFLIGAGAVWLAWWIRARSGRRAALSVPWLLTAALAVICAQSFLHSGMRAPYTYLSVFQEPQAQQHWYLVYHFPHQLGASQGDQYTFSPLEDYFQGIARNGWNGLIRRPFAFYVESQLSYFINDYYGWLALNCLAWLAAVFATARLVGRLTDSRTGLIAGALVLFGPGFLAFAATPAMYMQNYATAAIALCAFEDLIVAPSDRGPPRWALFAGVLALCALVYDLEPLFGVLLVYGLSRRVRWQPLVGTLGAAAILFEGFSFVVSHVLHIVVVADNSEQLGMGLKATWRLITHPSLSTWYLTAVTIVPSFFKLWLEAFFVVPALLALVGLLLIRDRSQRVLVLALLAYGFVVIAVLEIGSLAIGFAPRFVYPTFVGVYLPAAIALRECADRGRASLRRGASWE